MSEGDGTYPVAAIAKLLNLTPRRVQQLAAEGVIPKVEHGRYMLAGAVRGYVHYLQDQVAKAQSGGVDVVAERARLERAKADLAELEVRQRQGALLSAERIEAAWVAILALLRTRLLALPERLASAVHEQTNEVETHRVIRDGIRDVLDEMAEDGQPIHGPASGDGLLASAVSGGQ